MLYFRDVMTKTFFSNVLPFLGKMQPAGAVNPMFETPFEVAELCFQEERSVQEEICLDDVVRAMTFNVCWEEDGASWKSRKEKVASMVRFHRADLVGLQEPYLEQIEDLKEALPEYGLYSGVCLEGDCKGVHNPIFFRKNRFKLQDQGHFYLSETPERPSKGWDGKFIRGTSWVKLKDVHTSQIFFLFNTHFEYHGALARERSARLLLKKIQEIAKKEPFVVVGDFNLFPTMEGEKTYLALTETKKLQDTQRVALFPHHGPTGSWSGFKEAGQPGIKPDCIFVSSKVAVYLHGILSDTFDGSFASDHLPVVADLLI